MKENLLQTKKPVGVWIRVSTDEQADSDSPEHHKLRAKAYAEAKGWTALEIYDLSGVSGKTVMQHPECKRMMGDIRRRHITGLIFSKLARLSRNKRELEDFAEFFRTNDADMISIQDSIDTSTPAGRMFYTFQAAQTEWEREEIAVRVAASVPVRAKLGKPLGGQAVFGYQWKDRKLIPDPQEAPIRKLIYELFAEHKRKKTVARILNERGFRTRGGKSRKGARFSDTTITRLIADPTAKGEHRLNYTKSLGNGKAWSLKPEHEWVVIRVDPIVSVDLWDRCNALLEKRKVDSERPAKRGKSAFTGFVRCHCGKKMYVPFNTPKWVCQSCRNKIPATDLEAIFRDELKEYMVSAERVGEYLATSQSGVGDKKALLANARNERERVKTEADRCFDLYDQKALSVEQFKERFQPLDAQKKDLEREIVSLEAEVKALSIEEVSCEQIASEGRNFYDEWPNLNEDKRRSIVELFLREIVIGKEDVAVNLFTLPVFEMMSDGQRTPTDSSPRRA